MSTHDRAHPRVAVIGSGFGGIGMAMQLKRAGIESFTILEKSDRLGGTWRDNTYPGAACDSASFGYCFSFEQKTDWSRKWSPQAEILAYLEACARKYDLAAHTRFNAEVVRARFDEAAGVWRLRLAGGATLEAEVLVSGVGQLNRPATPDIPGLADFRGTTFHSARWDHAADLAGKRVVVVGNAASAIQFIPQIAPVVGRLTILQRSANWMLPKRDRAYRAWEKRMFARFPLSARLYRWWMWMVYESMFPLFRGHELTSRFYARVAKRVMRREIPDPALQRALLPDYPIGGKRILISDDYYPTLRRENVEVVTDPIARVTADGVETAGGRTMPADVIILATGFQTTDFLVPMAIEGLGGRKLHDVWREGAEAYLGMTVAGFPNFFMLYGPNTNLGHNSIIFMLECQIRYVVQCIQALAAENLTYLDVRRDVQQAFNRRLQADLARSVWARTPRSWYKRADGRITNNWSGPTIAYWWQTRHPDLGFYRQVARARPVESEVAAVA